MRSRSATDLFAWPARAPNSSSPRSPIAMAHRSCHQVFVIIGSCGTLARLAHHLTKPAGYNFLIHRPPSENVACKRKKKNSAAEDASRMTPSSPVLNQYIRGNSTYEHPEALYPARATRADFSLTHRGISAKFGLVRVQRTAVEWPSGLPLWDLSSSPLFD